MTNHVTHTNRMIFELKQQYKDRIDYLQKQILLQDEEIKKLNVMIQLLSIEKEYDI